MRATIAAEFPAIPIALPSAWPEDDTTVEYSLTPAMVQADRLDSLTGSNPVLVKRYACFLKPDQCRELLLRFDALVQTKPRHIGKHDGRSVTRAWHFGLWEFSSTDGPLLTTETRNQKASTTVALDALLLYLKEVVGKKIENIMKEEFPQMYERGVRYALSSV